MYANRGITQQAQQEQERAAAAREKERELFLAEKPGLLAGHRIIPEKGSIKAATDPQAFLSLQSRTHENSHVTYPAPHISLDKVISDDFPERAPIYQLLGDTYVSLSHLWDAIAFSTSSSLEQRIVKDRPVAQGGIYNHTGECFLISSLHLLQPFLEKQLSQNSSVLDPFPHLRSFLQGKVTNSHESFQLTQEIGHLLAKDFWYQHFGGHYQYSPSRLEKWGFNGGTNSGVTRVLLREMQAEPLFTEKFSHQPSSVTSSTTPNNSLWNVSHHSTHMLELSCHSSLLNERADVIDLQTLLEKNLNYHQSLITSPLPAYLLLEIGNKKASPAPMDREGNSSSFAKQPIIRELDHDLILKLPEGKKAIYQLQGVSCSTKRYFQGKKRGHAFTLQKKEGLWWEYNNAIRRGIPPSWEEDLYDYLGEHGKLFFYQKISDSEELALNHSSDSIPPSISPTLEKRSSDFLKRLESPLKREIAEELIQAEGESFFADRTLQEIAIHETWRDVESLSSDPKKKEDPFLPTEPSNKLPSMKLGGM